MGAAGLRHEVVKPERLVFTFAWEDAEGKPGHQTLMTVTFTERGDKAELTLHQAVFEDVATSDDHRRGWTSTLQRFAEFWRIIEEGWLHGRAACFETRLESAPQHEGSL